MPNYCALPRSTFWKERKAPKKAYNMIRFESNRKRVMKEKIKDDI